MNITLKELIEQKEAVSLEILKDTVKIEGYKRHRDKMEKIIRDIDQDMLKLRD